MPTELEMKGYSKIVNRLAKKVFYMYKGLFKEVGFELEDLININQVHLVSFLGLFSLEKMPEKYEEFEATYHKKNAENPKKIHIKQKNCANLTIFLKQRMEDMVRICKQKIRNIRGFPVDKFYFYYGPSKPPTFLKDLLGKHEKYGYKKLDNAVYRSIKKRAKVPNGVGSGAFFFNENYYVAVPIRKNILTINDLSGADMDPSDNLHNMNPEKTLFNMGNENDWIKKQEEFNSMSDIDKTVIVENFIEEYKEDDDFKEEIKTAKKLLRTIGS
jgi:hypothetical protein